MKKRYFYIMARYEDSTKTQEVKVGVTGDPLVNRVHQVRNGNREPGVSGLGDGNPYRYFRLFRCDGAQSACAMAQRLTSEAAFRSKLRLKANDSETDYIRKTSLREVSRWTNAVCKEFRKRGKMKSAIDELELRSVTENQLKKILKFKPNARLSVGRYVLGWS